MRDFMDVHHELQDILHSCLPRTRKLFHKIDMLLMEEESILLELALSRPPVASTWVPGVGQPPEFCGVCGCDSFECGGNVTGKCIR